MSRHTQLSNEQRTALGHAVHIAFVAIGLALLAAAIAADRPFFERHVLLPYYYLRPDWLPAAIRTLIVVAAVVVAGVVGPAAARRAARPRARRGGGGAVRAAVALLAALPASEAVLRVVQPADAQARSPRWEFRVGEPHPRYGWLSRPARATTAEAGGRRFSYVVGAGGGRVPAISGQAGADAARDAGRPTLVVIGESIAVGFGLDYDETFAARAGRALGVAVVNLGEGGYAPDQAHLRLVDALPGIAHPVAVVSVFVPVALGRMLDDRYPRLRLVPGGRLVFTPPASGLWAQSRLRNMAVNGFPYAGDAALERALATTGAVLLATANAARERGAQPLFVIPSAGPRRELDAHPEAFIVRRLFVDAGLPYILVDLGPDEIIPGDGHPNPAGARRIADAIVGILVQHPQISDEVPEIR
jgi:hypothetical protein